MNQSGSKDHRKARKVDDFISVCTSNGLAPCWQTPPMQADEPVEPKVHRKVPSAHSHALAHACQPAFRTNKGGPSINRQRGQRSYARIKLSSRPMERLVAVRSASLPFWLTIRHGYGQLMPNNDDEAVGSFSLRRTNKALRSLRSMPSCGRECLVAHASILLPLARGFSPASGTAEKRFDFSRLGGKSIISFFASWPTHQCGTVEVSAVMM